MRFRREVFGLYCMADVTRDAGTNLQTKAGIRGGFKCTLIWVDARPHIGRAIRVHGFNCQALFHYGPSGATGPGSRGAPHGIENENVVPGPPSLASAQRRPSCLSMIERLTNNPMPMPPLFVERRHAPRLGFPDVHRIAPFEGELA